MHLRAVSNKLSNSSPDPIAVLSDQSERLPLLEHELEDVHILINGFRERVKFAIDPRNRWPSKESRGSKRLPAEMESKEKYKVASGGGLFHCRHQRFSIWPSLWRNSRAAEPSQYFIFSSLIQTPVANPPPRLFGSAQQRLF